MYLQFTPEGLRTKRLGEGIGYLLQYSWASLVAQLVKTRFDPWVGKIPASREKPTGWRPRKCQCFSSSLKAGKKPVSQFKGNQARKNSFSERVSLFVLFRPITDWMRPSHNRERSRLYSAYQFKSHPKPPRITFAQISGHPVAQSG